jgi:RND family efflux transporter MFP subunit
MKRALFSSRQGFWLLATVLALLACGALVLAESRKTPNGTPPVPVGVEIAAPLPGMAGQRFTATLIPREQVTLSFKVAGYVSEIKPGPSGTQILDRGDRVAKGEILARVRDAEYKAKMNAARYALEEAKASKARAAAELAREAKLVRDGYLAKSEFDKTKELAETTAASVERASAQLDEARIQLADVELTCPLDGYVASRSVERGQLVSNGTKAFVVADFSSMKAVFGVPDTLVGMIKPGQKFDVSVEAVDHTVQGRITAVSPSADAKSKVFEVEVTIPNPDYTLKDGMAAVVMLGGAPQGALPSAPITAVVRPRGKTEGYAVYVVENRGGRETVVMRVVELGRVVGRRVELTKGAALGERIVVVGSTMVKDGDAVSVIPAGARP